MRAMKIKSKTQEALVREAINSIISARWHLAWVMNRLGVKKSIENAMPYHDYKFRRKLLKDLPKRIGCVGRDMVKLAMDRYIMARSNILELEKKQ